MKPLEGKEVCAVGCATSMDDRENVRTFLLVPCRFDVTAGTIGIHAPEFSQELVVELGHQRLATIPETPVRIVGVLRLVKTVDGPETWAWGKIEEATVEQIIRGR